MCSCLKCPKKRVLLFDPTFDISEISYAVHQRFIQLLSAHENCNFSKTNKANYLTCLRANGINVSLWLRTHRFRASHQESFGFEMLMCHYYYPSSPFSPEYTEKFKNFFKVEKLFINLETFDSAIPVFPTYHLLSVFGLKTTDDIDFICENYYHEKVEQLCCEFKDSSPEAISQMVNYVFQKMPKIEKYQFTVMALDAPSMEDVITRVEIPLEIKRVVFFSRRCHFAHFDNKPLKNKSNLIQRYALMNPPIERYPFPCRTIGKQTTPIPQIEHVNMCSRNDPAHRFVPIYWNKCIYSMWD